MCVDDVITIPRHERVNLPYRKENKIGEEKQTNKKNKNIKRLSQTVCINQLSVRVAIGQLSVRVAILMASLVPQQINLMVRIFRHIACFVGNSKYLRMRRPIFEHAVMERARGTAARFRLLEQVKLPAGSSDLTRNLQVRLLGTVLFQRVCEMLL